MKKTNCCNACVGPEDRCLFMSGRFATSLCAHGRKNENEDEDFQNKVLGLGLGAVPA